MRRVVLYIAPSIDGYIAGLNHELDWLFSAEDGEDCGFSEFLEGIDTIVMGRKTWEITHTFGPWPFGERQGYVFSRSSSESGDAAVQVIQEDPISFTRQLCAIEGRDIWLMGGGELVRTFLNHDLVDDYILSIHPVLLGEGIPLFPPGFARRSLKLESTQAYQSGLVQLHLTKAKPSS